MLTKKNKFIIIRGPTGCAKTRILQRLKRIGANAIDLEGIAKHKGSLLGSNPYMSQPSQKLFESQIYIELKKIKEKKPIFIESESSKIGNLFLPSILLNKIKSSPAIEINSNINSRVNFLLKDYKTYLNQKNSFSELFTYAKSKLGSKVVTKWKQSYKKKEWKNLAFQLITEYYDSLYSHNLKNKNNKVINKYHLKSLTNKSINDFCEVVKKDLGFF
jgi:tRNA 2-selenouridine synthase